MASSPIAMRRLGATPLRDIIALYGRPGVEQAIDRLIEMLDVADGDCDLEEDDPAGDCLDRGEGDDGEIMATTPLYAIDQSLGPINEIVAHRAHVRAILVPECRP